MLNPIDLKFGDLFSGVGGLSLGFLLANHPGVNFRPLFAIDNDKASLDGYKQNVNWLQQNASEILPKAPFIGKRDIRKLNSKALLRLCKIEAGELDLLIGGPPCQGYSLANRRSSQSSKAELNRLSKFFFDRLEEIKPKMFLLENVQGVKWTAPTSDMESSVEQPSLFPQLSKAATSVQNYMIERAQSLGFNVWCKVLNAVDFGVPQTRHRFFMLGINSEFLPISDTFSLDTFLEPLKSNQVMTVDDAISDLPFLQNGQVWVGGHYQPGTNPFVTKMRQYMSNGELYDHFTTKHSEYVIERYKQIPEGGNWESIKELMSNYSKIENTHSNIYRRLSRNDPAITISHYRKSMIIHPTQDRGISFREACRLQSFPDWCRFLGTLDQRQQQLANAVPPVLASNIAHAIASYWVSCDANITNENESRGTSG
jgi:DNA-cytosine methyltransferase